MFSIFCVARNRPHMTCGRHSILDKTRGTNEKCTDGVQSACGFHFQVPHKMIQTFLDAFAVIRLNWFFTMPFKKVRSSILKIMNDSNYFCGIRKWAPRVSTLFSLPVDGFLTFFFFLPPPHIKWNGHSQWAPFTISFSVPWNKCIESLVIVVTPLFEHLNGYLRHSTTGTDLRYNFLVGSLEFLK